MLCLYGQFIGAHRQGRVPSGIPQCRNLKRSDFMGIRKTSMSELMKQFK